MTLSETVLRKAGEWKPFQERQTLSVKDETSDWNLYVTADRQDELGCLVWELLLRRTGAPQAGRTLPSWAGALAEQMTALMEPLKVVEVDAHRNQAQLRSREPSARRHSVLYFEVLLTGTEQAVLRRFRAFPETVKEREQVAFPLTHEGLAKVASTLAGEAR